MHLFYCDYIVDNQGAQVELSLISCFHQRLLEVIKFELVEEESFVVGYTAGRQPVQSCHLIQPYCRNLPLCYKTRTHISAMD